MKTAAQRAEKRRRRENRSAKIDTWYCAGCKGRHKLNERCPVPRLFARSNRLPTDR